MVLFCEMGGWGLESFAKIGFCQERKIAVLFLAKWMGGTLAK
jgi:hypothetical protein